MSDFLDKVRRRQESPVAIAHRIALQLSSSTKNALVVEGGEDVYFYSSLCQRLRPIAKPDFFVGNGRDGVLGVLAIAKDLGKIDRCFGIIDRDFNFNDETLLIDDHCFVLGVYSFENYLGQQDTLIDVGRAMFALEPGTQYLERWHGVVENLLNTLPTLLIKEHACAYWCRLNNVSCYLENFNPCANVVHDGFGKLAMKDDAYEKFITDTKAVVPIEKQCEVDSALIMLEGRDWSMTFRGHYLWKLIVKILNDFREWLDHQLQAVKRSRSRTRAEITDRHALESCCSFANVPDELMSFLSDVGRGVL